MFEIIILIAGIVVCFIGAITMIKEYDSVGLCGLLITVGILLIIPLVHGINYYNFEKHKTVTYSKPTISILEETDTHIRLLIDNKEVKEYTEHKYYKTDNVYWQIETYKDQTNRTIVYKGE